MKMRLVIGEKDVGDGGEKIKRDVLNIFYSYVRWNKPF